MCPASRCQGGMLLPPCLTILSGHHTGLFRPGLLCLQLTVRFHGKQGGMYLAFTSSFSAAATRFCLAASAFACCLTAWCAAALRTSAPARSCCDLLTCNASTNAHAWPASCNMKSVDAASELATLAICGALPYAISYCDGGTAGCG